ncbi:Acetyl-CoA synthetase-like protein [Dioscorea alata]|uniref:Acetyl-CoA synthetase-like protein n=1 Tax=Dioscorea alata TaxID=55571 RepID=A0ACB7V6W8_DIOAL|nr:Acetyl-CoA synthetase-like protein [Dioscorea alata]
MDELFKCDANYVPLSPVNFLLRAAGVYSGRTSIIYKRVQFTWDQTYVRCRRLSSALLSLGIQKNDVVSVLAPNTPAIYEMHFGVPMAGGVLNTINTRLDAGNIATILKHSGAKIFFVDYEYVPLAKEALKILINNTNSSSALPLVIVIDDLDTPTGIRLGELEYECLLAGADPNIELKELKDEWDPIALNYTSGTTSAPKGVVYSHRGAYLSTMSLLLQWEVGSEPVYLWALPMFHCNGWTFTWGMAARGGANVCIRSPTTTEIYKAISDHKVTHFCCAPVVFNILLEGSYNRRLPHKVNVLTGGAPPPATVLQSMQQLGFHVTHAYGMTEATGPALVCEWRQEWDQLSPDVQSKLKARQGISVLTLAGADVVDKKTMKSVPRDGASLGEIVLRGSSIMKGYFKNVKDTKEAFKDGWFFTGDVGVVHPDGYIEIKDRSKDVIISGGENISSVEVESVVYRHPAVAEVAVVAMPHSLWGETPCAFVVLKKAVRDKNIKEDEILRHCKMNMAGFMVPKKVVFMEELPKNGNGKVVKAQLREMARRIKIPAGEAPVTVSKKGRGVTGSNGNNGRSDQQVHVLAVSRL